MDLDALFVQDGPFVTGAGISAGTDMALAIVENDYGTDVARRVARWMVVFLQRRAARRSSASGPRRAPPPRAACAKSWTQWSSIRPQTTRLPRWPSAPR
ncbi:hypothetical protein ACIF85_41885 [Streptomyces sp. NPDC086033]|uniref:hypothetical protein n=1 Tax=Streptomyces sp. NPDC086033 TaxID=3365747 RepID=UPI0037D6B479